ncbi:ammonium transporter [Kushneria aurantia]|uniref:Ammonium transporter n=1 Tax=Kushneria aurantia TaxID=504092 RepID=A0ABV6G0A7_9GAMM|nr:ammonium transporter [Kushneria aurantia]
MDTASTIDSLWVSISALLVFLMQAGFLCLEAGLTRSKNAINVAMKNVSDFAVSIMAFWLAGFGVMFGIDHAGWIGLDLYVPDFMSADGVQLATFFLFQCMFCATAATIVSGAVAERMPFGAYLVIALLVSVLLYPMFGHWAWGGFWSGEPGWLEALGFVDFAGSTVVHSLGGWVALAALLHIGPRRGRFIAGEAPRRIPASNMPLSMLGVLLLFFGWFGFNGGSTLAFDERVPFILLNTLMAGVAGTLSALLWGWRRDGHVDPCLALNGTIAGLVAVTAGAHALALPEAVLVGALGGLLMLAADNALLKYRIDDGIGAIPAHLAPGIWGTLAVGLLGDPHRLGTGLGPWAQTGVQLLGILVCALWGLGVAWLLFGGMKGLMALRVSADDEEMGLNVTEHGARSELFELLEAMRDHERRGDIGAQVAADPFTEVGQIAAGYNRVCRALERAVARTRAIVRHMRDGVVTWRADGTLTSLNPGAEALFGVCADQLIGTPVEQLLKRPAPATGERCELRLYHSGEARSLEIQISEGVADSEAAFSGMVRDITERKRLEEQLGRERELANVTLASIGDGVITTDDSGLVTFINAEAERLTGWRHEEARGVPVALVYTLLDEDSGRRLDNHARRVLASGQSHISEQTHLLVARDGQRYPVQDSVSPIRPGHGFTVGVVVVLRDHSATHNLTRQLNYQASHDDLTGLVNRREFEDRLAQALRCESTPGALCYLDLDRFKIVNDTCGHQAGDELLRQISDLLRESIRDSDVVARLGGDEFGLLLHDCQLDDARRVAEKIRRRIETFRFHCNGQNFQVGASMGLTALSSDEGRHSLSTLLGAADAACYIAKESGRNRICLADEQATAAPLPHQTDAAQRLQAALDEDRLRLHVQPVVAVDGAPDRATHHEFLVRLKEEKRLVYPGSFLPTAERYGLSVEIDRWVTRNALAWLSDQYRAGRLESGRVWSINLTAAAIDDDRFQDELIERIDSAALPAGALCFEFNESAVNARLKAAGALFARLHHSGCLIALDNFDPNFSALQWIRSLPIHYLKINCDELIAVEADTISRAMLKAINTLKELMGVTIVVKRIEQHDVLTQFQSLQIDFLQGFMIEPPQPLENMGSLHRMPR